MANTQTRNPSSETSWKRFIVKYLLVYLLVSVLLNFVLGPPDMSKDYLKEYEADHDHYIDTTKLDAYKRWRQRPELNPPDSELAARIAFLHEYTVRPEFKAEQRRRTTYGILIDLFNVAMVLFLAVHFGKKPLIGLLNGMIDNARAGIERAHNEREHAELRSADAQANLDGLPSQQADLDAKTAQRIKEMRREDTLTTGQRLNNLNRETEDRRRHEETLAQLQLKRELVDQALDVLVRRFRSQTTPEEAATLVDQFVQQLEHGR